MKRPLHHLFPATPAVSVLRARRRLAALAASILAAPVGLAQDGESGTVFENTHLPFESLKAPPDSAFDIVMVSVGVFLLVWLSIAAFLVLAKLDSIQQLLQKRVTGAAEAERAAAERAAAADDAGGDDGAAVVEAVEALRQAVEASAGRVDAALARLPETLAVDPSGTAAVAVDLEPLRATLEGALAGLAEQQREQSRALESALDSALGAAPATPAASAPASSAPATPALLVERVRTHLTAMGYEAIEVVTPREELDGDGPAPDHLVVEARRAGSVHKGRVILEDGAIADVQLRPAHRLFP